MMGSIAHYAANCQGNRARALRPPLRSATVPRAAQTDQAFPARIRSLREDRGWSKQRAAAECGVSRRTWHAWESGESAPTQHTAGAVAAAFGIHADTLLTGSARETQQDRIERKLDTVLLRLAAMEGSGAQAREAATALAALAARLEAELLRGRRQ